MIKDNHDIVTVRIRGPHTTALTKILIDEGYQIVQASQAIQKRFSIKFASEPADITIKTNQRDPRELLIVGDPLKINQLKRTLKTQLELVYIEENMVNQYSTIGVTINEKLGDQCIGIYHNMKILIETDECVLGKTIPAVVLSTVFSPNRIIRAKKGYSLNTNLYTLFSWKEVSISHHITNTEYIEKLKELSNSIINENFGIRWSSNATYVAFPTLKSRVLEDLKKLKSLIKSTLIEPNTIISEGRKIVKVKLNTHSDIILDKKREDVTPTLIGHHTLKTHLREAEVLIEFSEKMLSEHKELSELLRCGFKKYIIEKMLEKKKINIKHRKIHNKEYVLGPFIIRNIVNDIVILERNFKSPGLYDGLNLKKEIGDYGLTITSYLSNIVMHFYYSSNSELKGIYVNINTPVVFSFESLIYDDLEIDVVYPSNGVVSISDKESLHKLAIKGLIDENVVKRIEKYAENVKNKLEKNLNWISEPISLYRAIAKPEIQPELFFVNSKQE